MGNTFSRFTMTMLLLVTSIVGFAYDAEVDGIYYNLEGFDNEYVASVTSGDNKYVGSIDIPASIVFNGIKYDVKGIDDHAFYNCSSLTAINLPTSLINIGDYAFASCSSLTSITIPTSVVSLGKSAFKSSGLTSIEIPNSIATIEEKTFYWCNNLTTVVIPWTIDSIGDNAFGGTTRPQNIYCYAEIVPKLGLNVFSTYYSTLHVPSSCLNAYKSTDDWDSFSNYVGDNNTEKLCGSCGKDLTWTYNNGIMTISGSGEMYGYNVMSSDDVITPWENKKKEIKRLVINEGVTSIGERTFISLEALEYITFPNTLLDIKQQAFRDCESLKSIEIPSSVTHIGKWNFDMCPSVESIDVDSRNTYYWGNSYYNAIFRTKDNCLIVGCKNTIIPEGITAIDTCSFHGCTGLTSIHIPSTVKSIRAAFAKCSNLNSVTFDEGIETIGVEAFYQCTSLQTISLPNSVKTIDYGAFYGCSKLETINIPESVTTIRNGQIFCFKGTPWYDNYEVNSKNIVDNILYINNVAYDVIDKETKQLRFSESTVSISDYCFGGRTNVNYNIEEVVIPSNVFFIGMFAFPSTINKVTCLATTPPTCERYAFGDENRSDAILYVPKGTLEAYKNAYYWKNFKDIREISSTLSLTDDAPDLASGTYDAGSITYTRTTTPGKFATFCLPFDVDLSTMSDYITQAYTFAPWCTHTKLLGMLKLMVNKVENTQTISAGTPFIAKMKSDNVVFTNSTDVTYSEATPNPESTTLLVYDNDGISSVLTQNTDLTVKIGGTYTKMTDLDSDKYRAFTTSGGFGPTTWLNPFRAYVYKDDSSSSFAKISSIVIDLGDSEDEVTGISDVVSQLSTAPQTYYNLNGQRMNSTNLSKGLYITNGKKYIKK